ncbi:MAG: methylglyoxal synthase [Lachnospiraceae bacterium]
MKIGLIAQSTRKTLLENFCVAYKGILKKHNLYATAVTGIRIQNATGLPVTKLLPGAMGGSTQFAVEIGGAQLDMIIFFHNPDLEDEKEYLEFCEVTYACDKYNVPLATNIATAESLILGLENGDMEWIG